MKKVFLISVLVVMGFASSCTSKKTDEPFAYHYLDNTTVIAEFHVKNEKSGMIDTIYVPTQGEKGKEYNCVDTMSGINSVGCTLNHDSNNVWRAGPSIGLAAGWAF